MKLTILSSGSHAKRALDVLLDTRADGNTPINQVTCITSVAHDLGFAGLRLCPDLDAAVDAADATTRTSTTAVRDELDARRLTPPGSWPGLTDRAVASALARNIAASAGLTPTQAAAQQLAGVGSDGSRRAVRLLPVTESPVELHVLEPDGEARRGRHVQRWLADPARRDPEGFALAGLDVAAAGPGVLDAIRSSDVVVLVPMSPVLDAAGLLGVPGIRDALRGTAAEVVVMSPVGLTGTRDPHAEAAAWAQAGLEPTSSHLARLYADFADRLVIDTSEPPASYPTSMIVHRAPLADALSGDASAADTVRVTVLSPTS